MRPLEGPYKALRGLIRPFRGLMRPFPEGARAPARLPEQAAAAIVVTVLI